MVDSDARSATEAMGGLLHLLVRLSRSRTGFLARVVAGEDGHLTLVPLTGEPPTVITPELDQALRTRAPSLGPRSLAIPVLLGSDLVGMVGLEEPASGPSPALVGLVRPVVSAAAALLGREGLEQALGRAREALVRSERRLQLLSPAEVVSWEHDLARDETRLDARFVDWTGGARDTVPGDGWRAWLEPSDHADLADRHIEECREGARSTFEYEASAVRPDGEAMRLLVRGTFLRGPDGQATVGLGVATDITEDRRVENARRAYEARMRAVMESSLDGIVLCDEHGEIQGASRAAQKLFGLVEAELLGRNISTLVGNAVRGRGAAGTRLWDETGAAPLRRRQKMQALRKDGAWFPVECSLSEARIGPDPVFAVILRDLVGHPDARTPVHGVPVITRELPAVGVDRRCLGSVALEADGSLSFVSEGCTAIQSLDRVVRELVARAPEAGPMTVSVAGRGVAIEVDISPDPMHRGRRHVVIYEAPRPGQTTVAPARGMVGDSGPMRKLRATIDQVAIGDWTVLIEGETGVGKDLVAQAIHAASPRRAGRFVAVNCAGMTDSLLSSQLFGHIRGAFTGASVDQQGLIEAAGGGTLFLDEIGDISPDVQRALLRVLEDKEIRRLGETRPRKVDVRIISATHRDLARLVSSGQFREDLLYRIRVARVRVPPLRERLEDIPQIVNSFLARQTISFGKVVSEVSPAAMARLREYDWPGNVRELRSAIGHAVIQCRGARIELADLPPELSSSESPPPVPEPIDERARIVEALRRAGGNRSRAARLLGIGRATLYRRLEELQIPGDEER